MAFRAALLGSTGGLSWGCHVRLPKAPQLRLIGRAAPQNETDVKAALESLDALLGEDEASKQQGAPPQRAPRSATRKTAMGPGTASKFMELDSSWRGSWSYLAVGQQTEVGASQELPSSEPLVSYLVAAWAAVASCGLVLFPDIFPSEQFVMYPELAEEGSLHQFLAACFVSPTFSTLAVSVLLLGTAGSEAERVLGRTRFAATYLLAGASANVWYYALSEVGDPSAYFCGTAGGLAGISAALLAVVAKNRRMLRLGQQLRLAAAALGSSVAAIAADYWLWDDHTFIPGCYVAGGLAGAILGAAMSPRYEVLREIIIPDGSVEVPDDAKEVEVVVDKTSSVQQWGACLAFALALGGFTLLLTGLPLELVAGDEEFVDALLGALLQGGPEGAQELYEVAPEAWPLKA